MFSWQRETVIMGRWTIIKSKVAVNTMTKYLIVVALVALLVSLLFPLLLVINPGPRKLPRVKVDMVILSTAIESYVSHYGQLPFVSSDTDNDITFGIGEADITDYQKINGTQLVSTNSDLILVLMDLDLGVNANHRLNTQRHAFSGLHVVSDTRRGGVSKADYQFRDPWGNPYVISLDANHDGRVCDAVYGSATVSSNSMQGFPTNDGGLYYMSGSVMVWSRGPDGKASMSVDANTGVNKDNVLSWR
jgi:hypothetical protein